MGYIVAGADMILIIPLAGIFISAAGAAAAVAKVMALNIVESTSLYCQCKNQKTAAIKIRCFF